MVLNQIANGAMAIQDIVFCVREFNVPARVIVRPFYSAAGAETPY